FVSKRRRGLFDSQVLMSRHRRDAHGGAIPQQVGVNGFDLVYVGGNLLWLLRVGGEFFEKLAVAGKFFEDGGEVADVSLFEHHAVDVVVHHFRHAAEARADDGASGSHRFVDDQRSVFVPKGGDDDDVEVGEDVADL